jgi:hypothetical protein
VSKRSLFTNKSLFKKLSWKDKSFAFSIFIFYLRSGVRYLHLQAQNCLWGVENPGNIQVALIGSSSCLCDEEDHSEETWPSGWSKVGCVWKGVVFFFPLSIKYLRAVIYAFVSDCFCGFFPLSSFFLYYSRVSALWLFLRQIPSPSVYYKCLIQIEVRNRR